MQADRTPTMIALRATRQAIHIAWDINRPRVKVEAPTYEVVCVEWYPYVPETYLPLIYLPAPIEEEEPAPTWLVVFGLACVVGVVIAVIWAAIHFR